MLGIIRITNQNLVTVSGEVKVFMYVISSGKINILIFMKSISNNYFSDIIQ